MSEQHESRGVALVTGAANGIGAGTTRYLAASGMRVVVCDVDDGPGRELADAVGGVYVHCDVREPAHHADAVSRAVDRFGRLDVVHLNAGVSSGCALEDDFDLERYRRAMGINLDGVVFGIHAALPALRAGGGGQIVVTASMAGVVAVPFDPIYAANKHALVGLVRSLGVTLGPETGIRVNALCPSFAETAIISEIRPLLEEWKFPILSVDDVVAAFARIVTGTETGECFTVVPGRDSEPFRFRNAPGPRPVS